MKHLVHVSPVSRRRLEEGAGELLGHRLSVVEGDPALSVAVEVELVCHEDHGDVVPCAHLPDELPVLLGLEKGAPVGDGVADDESLAAAHVLLSHCSELDLSGGIEDVQQAGLGVDHGPLLVGVLDGRVVVVNKIVLHILEGEGRLAHATVSQDDNPEARGTVRALLSTSTATVATHL